MNAPCTIVLLVLAFAAHAQSPREELKQMVEQLLKTPNDTALRERIIKLAASIKPSPAIPEEAQRRMVRGTTAFKDARTTADYQDAAREFEQATLAAPWYGDAYYNLGVAQDKAEQYDAALRSLRLAQLTSPDSKEIKDLVYQVEYRKEKAESPAARARRSGTEEQQLLATLDGSIFDCPEDGANDKRWHVKYWYELKSMKLQYWQHILWASKDGGAYHLPLTPQKVQEPSRVTGKTTSWLGTRGERNTVVLDADRLTFTRDWTGIEDRVGKRTSVCRRR